MKKATRSTTSPTIYRSKLRSYESRSSASRNVSNFESDSNSEDDLSGSFNYKSPIRISSKQISKVGELLGHGSGKGRTSPVKLSTTTDQISTQKSLTPPTERSSQANVHNSFKSSNSVIVNVLDNSPINSSSINTINTNNVFNEPTSPVMITKCNNNNNKKIRNSRILFSSKSNQRSNNRDRNHNPDSLNDTCDLLDDICQDFNLTSFNTPNKLASQSKLGSSTPITIRYQSPLKIRRDNFIKRKHHTPLKNCVKIPKRFEDQPNNAHTRNPKSSKRGLTTSLSTQGFEPILRLRAKKRVYNEASTTPLKLEFKKLKI